MADRVTYEDLCQYYSQSLVLYKGKVHKVKSISMERSFRLLNLHTMKTITDPKGEEHIQPLMRRMGMLNLDGSVLYLQRQPVRKYNIGITEANVVFKILDVQYPADAILTKKKAQTFECPEIADMLFDVYPTLKESMAQVKEFGGASAFDKQFAVDNRFNIHYKSWRVGSIPKNCSTVAKIEWSPGYEHLGILLENGYEKSLRDSRKAA